MQHPREWKLAEDERRLEPGQFRDGERVYMGEKGQASYRKA